MEGFITKIVEDFFIDFGKSTCYQINNNPKGWEHATSLIKADDNFAEEIEANIAEMVKEEQLVEV